MLKFLFILSIIINLLYASNKNDGNKFIVLDSQTYLKVKILNILDGGITKKYLITSSKLSESDMIKYYPEYYLYNAKKCNVINNLIIGKKDNNLEIIKLNDKNNIKNEIKKIKLLQMLVDNNSTTIMTNNVSPKTIKSIGYICNSELVFKAKAYKNEDAIGNFIIKTINIQNNTIRLEVK